MGKIGRIIKSSDDLYELIGTQSVPETDVKGTDCGYCILKVCCVRCISCREGDIASR